MTRRYLNLLVLFCLSCGPKEIRGNVSIDSINAARKHVYALAQADRRTFYCQCGFEGTRVMANRCGYRPANPGPRAQRVEVEHIVPAAHLGRSLPAWRRGHADCRERDGSSFKGRNCARKVSALFRHMEADLYNLRPVIGEVNAARRDYIMGEIPGETRRFGRCDVEVENKTMEPRPRIRGDIARIWFYMEWAYPGNVALTPWQRKLYSVWSEADPVDGEERAWARNVERIQGNSNPFVR